MLCGFRLMGVEENKNTKGKMYSISWNQNDYINASNLILEIQGK